MLEDEVADVVLVAGRRVFNRKLDHEVGWEGVKELQGQVDNDVIGKVLKERDGERLNSFGSERAQDLGGDVEKGLVWEGGKGGWREATACC